MTRPEGRGIGRQLVAVLAVVAVVGGAVAPALAATPSSTWDGSVELSGTPSDGTTYQYDVQELDAISNFTVNLTGVTNTEWANQSGSVSASGSSSVSFAGTSLGGPSANGEPTLSVIGQTLESPYSGPYDEFQTFVEHEGTKTGHGEAYFPNPGAELTKAVIDVKDSYATGEMVLDVYAVRGERPDGTYKEGTKVKDGWDIAAGTGNRSTTFDTAFQTNGEAVTLEFVVVGSSSEENKIRLESSSKSSVYMSHNGGTAQYAPAVYTNGGPVGNVSVTADDGTTHTFGDVPGDEEVTAEFPVSVDATSLDWSSDGPLSYTLRAEERTQTTDAAIGLNTEDGGGWMNYSSTLAEGETVSLVTNESWVRSGTNTVDVAFNDDLSADAPEPKVQLDYAHRAATEQAVSVDAEQWSERWNTSRTWASDRRDAALTIPFGDNVVATRDVTVLSNGSQIGATSTSFNGTHLSVGLGDVEDGETTRVVAAGSKVQTTNGSIEVVEPTALGQSLDTKFEVVERSPGFQIDVGSTSKNQWLHYSHGESWSNPDSSALLESGGGQSLRFPNAPAGGTASVSTLAVDVDTSQDVAIDVAKPGSLVFDVENGPTAGDDVTFNYVGATSGTEYELVSLDRDGYRISRDSGSTAILRDDDSEETLQIRPINSSDSTLQDTSGGDGGGGIPPAVDPRANPYALLALSGTVIMGGVGLAAWRPSIPMWAVVPLLVPVTLIVIATQSPGTLRQLVAGKFGSALEQVGPALVLLGGTVVSYVIYKLAQSLGPDKTTVNFKGLRGGKK